MNASSEATWMKAARTGPRSPNAAKPTPTPSTSSVPAKLAMIIRRERRATFNVSTNLSRSFPSRTTSPLSIIIAMRRDHRPYDEAIFLRAREVRLAADEEAAILPARRHRDEISRRGQLDVDPELFLQHWNRPEQTIVLWDNADVDVNRRPAPSEQDGRRSSGEVHAGFGVGC